MIGHVATENKDGTKSFKIRNDHDAVKRAMEMDADYNNAMAEFQEEASYRPEREAVSEQAKEKASRRRGRRRSYFFFGGAA